MDFTILLPHFRTGKMTAFTLSQLLKHKGKHNIDIIVIDNNTGDGSTEYFKPFERDILYLPYPKNKIQSHGLAYDFAMSHVRTDYFVTIESDSFPTNPHWLDYIEDLINKGYDSGGSLLQLSGGIYQHPAGAFYKKSIWKELKKYSDNIQYKYFPNMARKDGFDCHLMVHERFVNVLLSNPDKFIELSKDYKGKTKEEILHKAIEYSPIISPFHNGMGNLQESFTTYGRRNIESEVPHILLDNNENFIHRIGHEPGQGICYWQLATGKKLFFVPTEVKWLPGRDNQQQEYTLMENGFKHLWGVSAYSGCDSKELQDIVLFKENQVEELYNSLPENKKI